MLLIVIGCVFSIFFEIGVFMLRRGNVQRFVLLNTISSKFIALFAVLSFQFKESSILDIGFLYLALSVIAPLALWCYYIYRAKTVKNSSKLAPEKVVRR